jgi:hypothetical protein
LLNAMYRFSVASNSRVFSLKVGFMRLGYRGHRRAG